MRPLRSLPILGLLAACSGGTTTTVEPPKPDRDGGVVEPVRDGGEDTTARDGGATVGRDGGTDAGTNQGTDAGPLPDPFAPLPDTSEGLTNVSADLNALLENGALEGACAAYEADPNDRRKKLLCGKYMFFYEHFGTVGVPAPLVDFATQNFPNEIGPGFEQLGMVPDPSSMASRPLGLAPGPPIGNVESLVYTCASCHFGQMPDGRYAVGAPNHAFDYGYQILTIALLPQTVSPNFDPTAHDPGAIARIQPMIDQLEMDRALRLRLLLDLLPLIGQAGMATLSPEVEAQYASWPPGTMDFLIAPLPLDDGVHTVSKISPLWDLPPPDEQARVGMPHAMLAWTGATESLDDFLNGFVAVGGGPVAEWPPERLEPLRDYIFSLRSPTSTAAFDQAEIERGRVAFQAEGCLDCHQGPRGSGLRTYTFDEIGTDDAMMRWADPDLTGQPCCGIGDASTMLTHGIKSPRLAGIWAHRRFLHNGALPSLEAVFCLDGPRETSTLDALGTAGHEMTCDLDRATKLALIAYLRSR